MAIGASNTGIGGAKLPLSLGGGCFLYTSTDIVLGTITDLDGKASIPFSIPKSFGMQLPTTHLQWGFADRGALRTTGFLTISK